MSLDAPATIPFAAHFCPAAARTIVLPPRMSGEIGWKFALGQAAGGNQPFAHSSNRGGIAGRLRHIDKIPA
jgi:hypothetical protein